MCYSIAMKTFDYAIVFIKWLHEMKMNSNGFVVNIPFLQKMFYIKELLQGNKSKIHYLKIW